MLAARCVRCAGAGPTAAALSCHGAELGGPRSFLWSQQCCWAACGVTETEATALLSPPPTTRCRKPPPSSSQMRGSIVHCQSMMTAADSHLIWTAGQDLRALHLAAARLPHPSCSCAVPTTNPMSIRAAICCGIPADPC